MASHGHIHVIDPDFRRRARITFELAQRNLHAEIYEDLEEFGSRIPDGGAIFIADEAGRCNARDVRAMLDRLVARAAQGELGGARGALRGSRR